MMQNNEHEHEHEQEVVRWEELLPKTVLRVLLVEPDFSTRQLLTALLRKCNYQVAPIADGLHAWEILKRRHNSIDLILTELDLPSISGFALLTLIMEHDGCKNIPVVVTSSQDCISMVLNCMLKGAADFLIKPVRKNELKNLWHHVWRRLSINDGLHASKQQKVKATFEKNSATDHSGDNASTSRKRIKFSENEGSVSIVRTEDNGRSSTGLAADHGSAGHTNHRCNNDSDILRPAEESGCCREAMDLIGSMNNPIGILVQGTSNGEFGSFDSMPELKLSLSLLHDSETTKKVDERPALNHSNASAFSWYDRNKESQSSCLLSIRELTDIKGITEASPQLETHDIIIGDKPTTGSQSVLDMGFWKGYAPNFQPILSSLKGLGLESAAKSPNSAFCREDSPYFTSYSLHSDPGTLSSTLKNSAGEAGDELRNRDSVDRHGYSSCNKFVDQKITLSGSASDLTEVNTDGPASALEKTVKEESCIINFELGQFRHRASLYSAEREAALARFRLKRKGRCFDKKVRYQSRKNLAEQRPRVKGQFVRHDQMVIDHIKLS